MARAELAAMAATTSRCGGARPMMQEVGPETLNDKDSDLWGVGVNPGDRQHRPPRRRPLNGRSTSSVPPGARLTFSQENTPQAPSRLEPLLSPASNTPHHCPDRNTGLDKCVGKGGHYKCDN